MTASLRTDTEPVGWPWALPELPRTTRHYTFHARLRRARARFLASAFVADVTHGYQRALAILGALLVLYVAFAVVRGFAIFAYLIGVTPAVLAAVVAGLLVLSTVVLLARRVRSAR